MFKLSNEFIGGWLLCEVPEVTPAQMALAFGVGQLSGMDKAKGYGPRSWNFSCAGVPAFHVYTRDNVVRVGGMDRNPRCFCEWLLAEIEKAISVGEAAAASELQR